MKMFNPNLKLNQKVFDDDVEKISLRRGFGRGLMKAAEMDKRIVGLCADLTESTSMTDFRNGFPERFIEIGVAEQNLATVASGMAAMGKIPFMGSFAIFSPGRNWEQIRTTIAYNDRPVKIVGSHAGLSAALDGGSHQALEDIALMRVLPRMVVVSPCDAIEARKATMAIAMTSGPAYLRLTRNDSPVMTSEETPFEIGKASVVFDSRFKVQGSAIKARNLNIGIRNKLEYLNSKIDAGIIATGALLHEALKAAKKLDENGKRVSVMNLSTIKPLDQEAIIQFANDCKAIVTVEEHQIAGGMGSAVAECLAAHNPVPIEFIGVKDRFGQSGKPEELMELYEIGEKSIFTVVEKVILRK